MAKISRLTMSIVGTDGEGKEKHVAVDITDPAECAGKADEHHGNFLASVAEFAEPMLDNCEDGHKLVANPDNADETLND